MERWWWHRGGGGEVEVLICLDVMSEQEEGNNLRRQYIIEAENTGALELLAPPSRLSVVTVVEVVEVDRC